MIVTASCKVVTLFSLEILNVKNLALKEMFAFADMASFADR